MSLAWNSYDKNSKHFFEIYENFKFSTMHRLFLRFLPEKNESCLDVGAGSGRDAAALARRGYKVTAVEPSENLLKLAQQHHHSSNIRWVNDSLPKLKKVAVLPERYSFILLSAVWMHISPDQRLESLITLKKLLKPRGYIAITLRIGISEDDRLMYPVSVNELINQAETVGLKPEYVSRKTDDLLKRNKVEWRKVVLSYIE